MAVLDLRFCARAFSSCGERGPLFIAVRRPLTIAASLVAEHRLQTRRLSNCVILNTAQHHSQRSLQSTSFLIFYSVDRLGIFQIYTFWFPLQFFSFLLNFTIGSKEKIGCTFNTLLGNLLSRTSLVAQWLRIHLPMQGTLVGALVWEDPTCHGTTRPVCHKY